MRGHFIIVLENKLMGKDTNSPVTNWTYNPVSGGAARHRYCSEDWEITSDL